MAQKTEDCENCGKVIGRLEKAYVYEGQVVCHQCSESLRHPNINTSIHDTVVDARLLLAMKPSLLAMIGIVCKGFILPLLLSVGTLAVIPEFSRLIIILIWVAYILYLIIRSLELRFVKYTITSDRIEYERGILSRSHDNIDLFRITDLTMRLSLLDRLLGIGSIYVISSDKTDPTFKIYKIPQPQKAYDILKKESLHADRRRGVIHVE